MSTAAALASSSPTFIPLAGAPATLEQWLQIPEEQRAELIQGRLVYQSMPGPAHGIAQGGVVAALRFSYHRGHGDDNGPGGWWISQEVDADIQGFGCRPDVLGWRRDRHAALPEPDARGLVTAVPDWICEVLSRSTAHIDLGAKRIAYHRAGVEHYWVADPANETLTVLRRTPDGYVIELSAGRGDIVRAVPFDLVEINVDAIFGT